MLLLPDNRDLQQQSRSLQFRCGSLCAPGRIRFQGLKCVLVPGWSYIYLLCLVVSVCMIITIAALEPRLLVVLRTSSPPQGFACSRLFTKCSLKRISRLLRRIDARSVWLPGLIAFFFGGVLCCYRSCVFVTGLVKKHFSINKWTELGVCRHGISLILSSCMLVIIYIKK